MTGEDYNLSWVCSHHLVCGKEIGDLIIARLTSASNQLVILTDGTCLNALSGHEFHCVSPSIIDQLRTGKSDILNAELFREDGFPLVA